MGLIVIYGPMFAGKTTRMIQLASEYHAVKKGKILLITCDLDTRDVVRKISSHFGFFTDLSSLFDIVCVAKDQLSTVDTSQYSIVCVDETQFFTDLLSTMKEWRKDRIVICAGLKADFEQNPFGEFNQLFSPADRIIECTAHCHYCPVGCHPHATHTRRKFKQDELIVIGAEDLYEPVCGDHL